MNYVLLILIFLGSSGVFAQDAVYNFNFIQPSQTGSVQTPSTVVEIVKEVETERPIDFDLSSGLRLSTGAELHNGQRGFLATKGITLLINTSATNDFFIGIGKSSYHELDGDVTTFGLQRITDSGFKINKTPITLSRFIKATFISSDTGREDGVLNQSITSYGAGTLAFGLTPEIRLRNIAALGLALDVSYGTFGEKLDNKETNSTSGFGFGMNLFLTVRI